MTKMKLLNIARWLVVLLLIVYMIVSCAGNRISKADPAAVSKAVLSAAELSHTQEADAQMVKRLYGVDPAEYDSVVLQYPATNMDAEELLLVKLRDVSQQEALLAAANARIDTQKTSFDGYGPAQYALLTEHCIIETRGNYFLLVVCENAQAAKEAFEKAL
ncbi:MAG: DUF4358 domain-containing protein [Clostridia bacterium]|nr:DUF4358 domain-containing protein [Clostridia bacterium]